MNQWWLFRWELNANIDKVTEKNETVHYAPDQVTLNGQIFMHTETETASIDRKKMHIDSVLIRINERKIKIDYNCWENSQWILR